jgi:hypothetical protein
MFFSALHCLAASISQRARRHGCIRRGRVIGLRPWLEILEARLVPDAVRWINPAGGDWDTPSNWNTGALPHSTDDVQIDWTTNPVTHAAGFTDSIHSLASMTTLSILGGALSVGGNASSTTLNLSGGTLTVSGTL